MRGVAAHKERNHNYKGCGFHRSDSQIITTSPDYNRAALNVISITVPLQSHSHEASHGGGSTSRVGL